MNHKGPSTWNELAAERKNRVRRIEEENSPSFERDESGGRSKAVFADPDYFPSLCRQGVISTQECLELMTEQNEGEEAISEEEWLAQFHEAEESYRARDKKRLEDEAEYSWEASEELRALIEKEELQKASAECAEEERRREAIKAEAEESNLNWLFGEPEEENAA